MKYITDLKQNIIFKAERISALEREKSKNKKVWKI